MILFDFQIENPAHLKTKHILLSQTLETSSGGFFINKIDFGFLLA